MIPDTSHDDYTAKAVDADRRAANAKDPRVAGHWTRIAESYRELARQVLKAAGGRPPG